MSFPKANIKRFNEVSACAPPVGSYDPKLAGKQSGALIDKSERFKTPKDGGLDVLDTPSKRRIPSDSVSNNSSMVDCSTLKPKPKKTEQTPTAETVKIKELEREIRLLLQERTNQDKLLCQRDEELTKLEGRLANAQTDRSCLMAKVATLEKSIKDANKSNDLLKNKITAAENSGKKTETLVAELSGLKHQLDVKDKEIQRLRQELDALMKTQLSDFVIFESLVVSLEKKVVNLENKIVCGSPKKTELTKTETDKSERAAPSSEKLGTSKKNVQKLKKRFEEAIESYSSKVEDLRESMEEECSRSRQQQEDLEAARRKTEEDMLQLSKEIQTEREKAREQRKLLYSKIRSLTDRNWTKEDEIRFLKGEVSAEMDHAGEMGQEKFELEAEMAVLTEKMEHLEEEKNTLNENIRILMEKFQILEKNHGQEKKSSRDIIQNLEFQLGNSQTSLGDIQKKYSCLEERNNDLIRKMHEQMEEVEKLTFQLDGKEKESTNMKELIKEKENLITDLDVQLVGARIAMQNLKEESEVYGQEVEQWREKVQEVEDSLRRQLREEEEVHQRTVRGHADQIIDLKKKEMFLMEENEILKKKAEESAQLCRELKDTVEKLSTDITDVRKQSEEELKRLRDTTENDWKMLEASLQQVRDENENLQRSVTEKEETLLNYQCKVSNLEEKEATLRLNVESLEREYAELKQSQECTIESIIEKEKETRNENVELKRDLECTEREKQELFCKVAELQVSITEMQSSLAEKQNQLETLSAESGDMDDRLRSVSVEKEKLDLAVVELNDKLKEAEEGVLKEKRLLQETETALKAEVETLRQEMENSKEEWETLQQKVENSKEKLETLQQEVENSQEKLETLQQEVEKSKDVIIQKEKHVTSLMVENSQLMKEIDYLRSVREQDHGQTSEKLVSFEERVKQLIEEKASLYQKTADVVTEKERLETENGKMTTRVTHLEEQKQSYEQVITALGAQVRELQVVNGRLQEDYDQAAHAADDTRAERDSRIQALELQLCTITEENSCLTDQMGQAEQVKCKLKADMDSLKENIASLMKSHDAEVHKHLNNIQELQKSLYISTNSNQKELDQLQSELSGVVRKKMEDNKLFTEKIRKANSELQSEKQIRQTLEEEFNLLTGKCSDLEATGRSFTNTIHSLEGERDLLHSQNHDLHRQMSEREDEQQRLQSEIQNLQSAFNNLEIVSLKEKEDHAQEIEVLKASIQAQANQAELDHKTAEAEKWQKLFEDLQAKVEPFMDQLDAFELEKQSLLGRSNYAQAEMDRLASQYAKLLGHQNQKQKIHHVAKIKEENISLKKEMTMLREQITKQKRTIQKLEDKVGTTDGKKKFDPTMAFKHSKENLAPSSSPLKDGNRK